MAKINIGKVLKPFGVKGAVKVYSYSDFSEQRFAKGQIILWTNHKGEILNMRIEESHPMQHPCWAIQFQGIYTMNDAEKLRDGLLVLEEEDIPQLPEGEYYFRDLLNCNVYQNKNLIGKVIEVSEGVACNYLRVLGNDKKTHLVPFLPQFIIEVRKQKKEIDIIDMKGLI